MWAPTEDPRRAAPQRSKQLANPPRLQLEILYRGPRAGLGRRSRGGSASACAGRRLLIAPSTTPTGKATDRDRRQLGLFDHRPDLTAAAPIPKRSLPRRDDADGTRSHAGRTLRGDIGGFCTTLVTDGVAVSRICVQTWAQRRVDRTCGRVLAAAQGRGQRHENTLFLGPDHAGNIIEILARPVGDDVLIVFHAMPARTQFLALLADRKE